MKYLAMLLPIAVLSAAPAVAAAPEEGAAPAAKAEKAEEARIPFANHGGIRDWKEGEGNVVYFQDRHKTWYKAELMMRPIGIGFVHFIGVDTGTGGALDRWSTLFIDGQRYALKSFTRIDGNPPSKADKKAEG